MMKKTKLLYLKNRCTAAYEYYPFDEIFTSINQLQKIDSKNEKEIRGILYTIIIQCTTFIEGMCSQIMFSTIQHKIEKFEEEFGKYDDFFKTFNLDEDKEFYIRVLKNLERKIDESYFKELETNWKLVYNQNIKEEIAKKDSELWKSIGYLFSLRNAITHGHVLTIEYIPQKVDDSYEINVLGKYQRIYNFFSEKNLIEVNNDGRVSLINKKIINFYIKETQKFISALILILPKNIEKHFAINQLQMIREKGLY